MNLSIAMPQSVSVSGLGWNVEAELQRELDAVTVHSHPSSPSVSSSAARGMEGDFPADDYDNTSSPLKRLLEQWHNKEKKLNMFEMIAKVQGWQTNSQNWLNDEEQRNCSEDLTGLRIDGDEWRNTNVCLSQQQERQRDVFNLSSIDGTAFEEDTTNMSPADVPATGFTGRQVDMSESMMGGNINSLQDGRNPSASLPECLVPVNENCGPGTSYQGDRLNSSSRQYDDKCSILRGKEMPSTEIYWAAEPPKNDPKQRNLKDLRKATSLASEGLQEPEQEALEKKLALLDLEQAKQLEWLDNLQRAEERELEDQKMEVEQSSRFLLSSPDTFKILEEELELRRSMNDGFSNITKDKGADIPETVRNATDNHLVKCCVLIQARVRGFLCRRSRKGLTLERAIATEKAVLSRRTHDSEICEKHINQSVKAPDQTCTAGLSSQRLTLLHEQEDKPQGLQEGNRSLAQVSDGLPVQKWAPEEISRSLSFLVECGHMNDLRSRLELAKSLGFNAEAQCAETQLVERQEGVCSWLGQLMQGWEVKKCKIQEVLKEARRLELYSSADVAEEIMLGREKEIGVNLEASVLKGIRCRYNYWLSKAKVFGLGEELTAACMKHFQRKCETVKNSLQREAALGNRRSYSGLLRDAASLGLDSDVRLALKTIMKRVLLVFKRGIVLKHPFLVDNDDVEPCDQKSHEMEGADVGLDSQALSELRGKVSEGRDLEDMTQTWMNTFKTDDAGIPYAIVNEKCHSTGPAVHTIHVLRSLSPEDPDEASSSSEGYHASISGCTSSHFSENLWVLNWIEMNNLQLRWQKSINEVRMKGQDNLGDSQLGQDDYFNLQPENLRARTVSKQTTHDSLANYIHRQVQKVTGREDGHRLNLNTDKKHPAEDLAVLSESEDDLRHEVRAHSSAMLDEQETTPRRSTLTQEIILEKLNCGKTELKRMVTLDLTDTHLKSLGKASLFQLCPRLRTLIVDMNKLTNFGGVLRGGEGCLERLSARDNLLQDAAGLKGLRNLEVLHLDGNSLPKLGLFLDARALLSKQKGRKEQRNRVNESDKNCCNLKEENQIRMLCWPRLRVLTVSCNQLTKVSSLESLCPNLEVLDLGSNQIATFGDADENVLAGLAHLRFLDVGQNRLQGRSLWKGLENCPELLSLVASRNKLRELPTHFGSVLLREIWLNGNAVKRLTCNAWLPNLQRLYLQDNMIDVVEPVWGCPALEVLDLSFNNISELACLRHLSCFPNLRSLQLNDNPVSEGEEHVEYVLHAVPWLVELDNEAVPKAWTKRAMTRILKKIMKTIGLDFLKDKLASGEVLLPGAICCSIGHSAQNSEHPEYCPSQMLDINNILNGEADEEILLKLLSEIKRWVNSKTAIQDSLSSNVDYMDFEGLRRLSRSELEAKSNVNAYQQMIARLKGRLHATTKERCIGKLRKAPNDHHLNILCHVAAIDLASDAHPNQNHAKGGIDLEGCLDEHITFDSNSSGEDLVLNKEYELQVEAQRKRVIKLQALARGFLARERVCFLRQVDSTRTLEQQRRSVLRLQAWWRGSKVPRARVLDALRLQKCACCKIQAHWRGYYIRSRFKRAMAAAKYVDDDDYEYVAIDSSEFLEGEMALSTMFDPSLSLLSTLDKADHLQSRKIGNPKPSEVVQDLQQSRISFAPESKGTKPERDPKRCEREAECHLRLEESPAIPKSPGNSVYRSKRVGPTWRDKNVKDDCADLDNKAQMSATEADTEVIAVANLLRRSNCIQAEAADVDIRALESLKKATTPADTKKDITRFLKNTRFGSNLVKNHPPTEGRRSSENVTPGQVEAHVAKILSASQTPADNIINDCDEIDQASVSIAEIKQNETIEQVAKDWGLKNERTAQALCKARKRINQQAKEAAHRNLLQDPELRLKRFREKVRGQGDSPTGFKTKQREQRASLNFHKQELECNIMEPEQQQYPSDKFPGKLDVASSLLHVPKLLQLQKQQQSSFVETGALIDKMRWKPSKAAGKEMLVVHLPRVALDSALPYSSFINQRAVL